MKNLIFVLTTCLLSLPMFSQNNIEPEALGLPGDNLNLYAVLDVFQKSPTLEEFEKAINDKSRNINNLDLNNDGVIDYISVVSTKDGNTTSVVLRVAVNSKEFQDLAVIEVHKNKGGKILVQVIGDENLYGKNYIVEPSGVQNAKTPNPGYSGNTTVIVNNYNTDSVYYANEWPIMGYLYSPGFSFYVSPFYWGYYPSYWNPWAPIGYYDYWGYHNHYYIEPFYRRTGYLRYPNHYATYYSRRNSSPIVTQYRRNGDYNRTYNGKVYQKPAAPAVRTRAETRALSPATRTQTPATRSQTSATRSQVPGTRTPAQATKPQIPQQRAQTPARQQKPQQKQQVPQQRQQMPQQMPQQRQQDPQQRQQMPQQRSQMPAARPMAPAPARAESPAARSAAPGRRE